MKEVDIAIIGGGPAGLTAGLYGARATLETVVLEKQAPGGQILLTDLIENYPGFPGGINPEELSRRMKAQVEEFGGKVIIDEVDGIEKHEDFWKVNGWEDEYVAKAIIIATGSEPKKLGVPGEREFTGKGVSYCATCDGPFFKGQPMAVVGGGDSAVSEAIYLTKYASKVYLIHRRDKLRAEGIWQKRAFENPKIEFVWDTVVKEIRGEKKVKELLLENVKTGKMSTLPVEAIFIFIGMNPNVELVKDIVELAPSGRIKVNMKMETSAPGIFAAGDVIDIAYEQVSVAVGTGAIAAMSATEYINRNFG